MARDLHATGGGFDGALQVAARGLDAGSLAAGSFA